MIWLSFGKSRPRNCARFQVSSNRWEPHVLHNVLRAVPDRGAPIAFTQYEEEGARASEEEQASDVTKWILPRRVAVAPSQSRLPALPFPHV
jgi:hypothetical protein